MAHRYDYVIGDVQGCFAGLQQLLKAIDFDANCDCLWFTGDLVARGEDSLAVLRWVKAACEQGFARTVLGNHDLNLLAIGRGHRRISAKDCLDAVVAAHDVDELFSWLRHQPLLLRIDDRHVLVHAGIPPFWSVAQALQLSQDVASILQDDAQYDELLATMYEREPLQWQETLTGMARLRVIINYLTRMRIMAVDGMLNLQFKADITDALPSGYRAWFDYPRLDSANYKVCFGHWAALAAEQASAYAICVDGGFVWGGELRAYCIQTKVMQRIFA